MKLFAYEGETEVDEVVGKAIKRRKSYNIAFHPTSILSFWSTSVKNILEYGKFIDVLFYHFGDGVRIAVAVRTHAAVSRSRRNKILSMNFILFYSSVVIWIQKCILRSSIKYQSIHLCLYQILSFLSYLST